MRTWQSGDRASGGGAGSPLHAPTTKTTAREVLRMRPHLMALLLPRWLGGSRGEPQDQISQARSGTVDLPNLRMGPVLLFMCQRLPSSDVSWSVPLDRSRRHDDGHEAKDRIWRVGSCRSGRSGTGLAHYPFRSAVPEPPAGGEPDHLTARR
jgi:hypothetical protein